MSVISRLLPENPVLTKEMRVRMRGPRAYWILLGYLGFLTAVLLFLYSSWLHDIAATGYGASESSETGKNIYVILLVCQAFLVLFITPAITSGSITIEKEQQTLDMLTMTRLSRASMIVGKLVSAVSFTALLLISSLPLVSICFMLGGVDPAMVVSAYLAMLTGSFLLGAIGLMWSSIAKTTTVAVLLTYLSMLAFALVVGYAVGVYGQIKSAPMAMASGSTGETAVVSVVETWCSPGFLGIPALEYVGFVILSLLAGTLLSTIAMSRLETWPDRRAGLIRGLTAVLILLQVAAACVWWFSRLYGVQGIGVAKAPALGALCVPLLLLSLCVPIFATGEIHSAEARRFGRYLLWGWTPKGLARGRLASGVPFLVLLTLLCIGVYPLTLAAFGKSNDLMHSASLPVAANDPTASGILPGAIQAPARTPVNPTGTPGLGSGQTVGDPATSLSPTGGAAHRGIFDRPGDFPQAIVVILTFVIGFALFCQFLSIAFDNRWVACALAYLVLVVVLIVPWMTSTMGDSDHPWITVNLAYLNPFFVFAEMTAGDWSFLAWAQQKHLILLGTPMWLANSIFWTLIGSVSLLGTLPFAARRASSERAIPHQDAILSS